MIAARLPVSLALAALASGVMALACRSAESLEVPAPQKNTTPSATALTARTTPFQPSLVLGPKPVRRFGQSITAGDSLSLTSVLATPDEFINKAIIVEAKVRRNCTRRGCWMELAGELDPTAPGCRVTFKDYGFFIPLDSAGSSARVQGVVQVETVTAPEVEHLESEGAKFAAKRPDGTAREVRMVATGVELFQGPT